MKKKTHQPKKSEIVRNWHLVDADSKILGRMASEIAQFLIGKHKKNYANNFDMGDYVVVINAKKVELTGRKAKQKVYRRHSGYPGGFKEVKYEQLIEEHPAKVIEYAVSGMLPKNRLKDKRMRRLKVFAGSKHDYVDKLKD